MEPKVYVMHKGARSALKIAAFLVMLLVITLPLGIWWFIKVGGARVELRPDTIQANGLTNMTVPVADIQRVGILRVPIVAKGLGASLAKAKVGGNEGVNLCMQLRNGKTKKFVASMYENYEDIFTSVSELTGLEMETLKMGMMGPKWQDAAA